MCRPRTHGQFANQPVVGVLVSKYPSRAVDIHDGGAPFLGSSSNKKGRLGGGFHERPSL